MGAALVTLAFAAGGGLAGMVAGYSLGLHRRYRDVLADLHHAAAKPATPPTSESGVSPSPDGRR